MPTQRVLVATLSAILAAGAPVAAQNAVQESPEDSAQDAVPRFEARLAGHAILPAATFIAAPDDAPEALRFSGKFIEGGEMARLDAEPKDAAVPPFNGQPIQGFSGIKSIGGERFLALTDNGFGTKANSPDAMLGYHVVRPDFATGEVAVETTIFLSDPNEIIPFVLAMEGAAHRYLTGADLDPESFQPVGDAIVIGDEFGPYVAVVDRATGVVTELHETLVDGETLRSPDHYALRLPDPGGALPAYRARRSRGFEGLAASPDGATLYPLLEGPLWIAEEGDVERVGGRAALRILEMTAADRAWTGRHWLYPLEADGHAIGDFNMIDATRGLVIERDSGQGHPDRACGDGESAGCFARPARFKRVYLIDMAGVAPGQPVRKLGYIDLMDIADPDRIARAGARGDGRFAFPFVTIENVDRVDADHILVANDNNYPFSSGRDPGAPDDTEFILLEVGAFLRLGDE